MLSDEALREFKFRTSPVATNCARGFGLILVLISYDFLGGWLRPSLDRLPYMLLLLPFGLLLCSVGIAVFTNSYDIEILDGRLRFRRLLSWKSVPLESISVARYVPVRMVLYIRVDHNGARYRIFCSPHDYKLRTPSGRSVTAFLKEVSRRGARW